MSKINKDNFAYLGIDYQLRLMAQLITDSKFANSIIDIIDPNYFDDQYLRIIAATIIDAKNKFEIIPDVSSLQMRLLEEVTDPIQRKFVLSQFKKVQDVTLNDGLFIQDMAMKFCKQQALKKSLKDIQKIIDKGNLDEYEQCENILRKALEHGDNKDDGVELFDNIDSVLDDDFRKPIRTGIGFMDEVMDGGLSRGEVAVILAPFGVGKTTMVTKLGSTGLFDGLNVLQIFFEDTVKVIQRKHIACHTGIQLNELSNHKNQLAEIKANLLSNGGVLKLKKFSTDGTTMPMIRNYIRKLISSGFRPDVVLLDYIDCVQPSKHFDDVNAGEGSVMRQFESMASELNFAGWTAIQGNRSAIKSEVVEADQMGGSIKKAQIAHFIVSIAKTLEQKENNTATMAILKSRFGQSGLVFENIIFNNGTIQISDNTLTVGKSYSERSEDKEKDKRARLKLLMEQKEGNI